MQSIAAETPSAAEAPSPPAKAPRPAKPAGALGHAGELSRRAIFSTFRQPQSWLPGFFFPILLALIYTSQFDRAAETLEGFPAVDSFLDFILPASVLQGVSFGATNGASDLAIDIERGFFDRLLVSPVRRVVILLGRMAGTMTWAFVQSIFFILVFSALGAEIKGGFGAAAVLVASGVLLGLFIGSLAMGLALRTGSEEVVQSVFPAIFAFIFLSSAFFPTELMSGWYQTLAENNPITFIIDPLRRMIIGSFSFTDSLQALLVSGLMAAFAMAFALLQLRFRLRKSR